MLQADTHLTFIICAHHISQAADNLGKMTIRAALSVGNIVKTKIEEEIHKHQHPEEHEKEDQEEGEDAAGDDSVDD